MGQDIEGGGGGGGHEASNVTFMCMCTMLLQK